MSQDTGTRTLDSKGSRTNVERPVSRVVAIRRPKIEGTELWLSVHVVGPENGPGFAQMLARAGCRKSQRGVEDADLVIFTGGSCDIHPVLYGVDPQNTHDEVFFEDQECIDTMLEYIETWKQCLYAGIPMVGVCLGAQFLAVMNGSKLYQHVDSHYSDHSIFCHMTGETIKGCSSVHHQMVIRDDNMKLLAEARDLSGERWHDRRDVVFKDFASCDDVEAFWYEQTLSLGFQGHPEYQGYPEYTEWCLEKISHFILHNSKLEYQNNYLRLKEGELRQRNFSIPKNVNKFIKEYS